MASIRKRGETWRAEVWADNQRVSASFRTKKEAEDWAHQTERRAKTVSLQERTFGDLLDRYRREVTPKKIGDAWEAKRVAFFERLPLAEVKTSALTTDVIAKWRDARLKGDLPNGIKPVSGSTVNRDFNLLSNVCRYAVEEWKWLAVNPFTNARRPKENDHRDRLVSDEEIERLVYVAGDLATVGGRTIQAFRFSVETGLRAGELLAMDKTRVFPDYVHVAATKPGERKSKKRDVPLSGAAKFLLAAVLDLGGDIWELSDTQLESNFRLLRTKAMIENLTYHDSRHAACTRLARKLTPFELARMMGWKDLSMAMRYYNESASEIAKKL